MNISDKGLNLIKEFEGCRLTAYKCPAGVWTIGYGHTSGVKSGDVITESQATTYLKADLKNAENAVNKINSHYDFNQGQFDALVSFTYNCGAGNLTKLTASNSRTKDQIGSALLLYNKANGKVLTGLVRRRKAEQELYNSCPETAPVCSRFYPKYLGKSMSIDEVLSYIGAVDDYNKNAATQWQKRIPIASANGIKNYKGSMSQNIYIINKAKSGELIKV